MVVPNDVTGGALFKLGGHKFTADELMYGHGRPSSGLTGRQLRTLDRHAAHHSEEHMAHMRKRMREGASFFEAHKEAQELVGGVVVANDVTVGHCGEVRGGYVVANDIVGGGAPSIFAM